METFSALLSLCAGNSPVTCELPVQRPLARSFYVFFHLCLNKRLSKQSQAGDLRRRRALYGVIVIVTPTFLRVKESNLTCVVPDMIGSIARRMTCFPCLSSSSLVGGATLLYSPCVDVMIPTRSQLKTHTHRYTNLPKITLWQICLFVGFENQ